MSLDELDSVSVKHVMSLGYDYKRFDIVSVIKNFKDMNSTNTIFFIISNFLMIAGMAYYAILDTLYLSTTKNRSNK